MPIIQLIDTVDPADGLKFAAALAASIAVGILLHLVVERPVAGLRNRVRKVRLY